LKDVLETKLERFSIQRGMRRFALRGKKNEPFETGAAGGGVEWMSYVYENVELSFVSSFHPEPDSVKKRREYVFFNQTGPCACAAKAARLNAVR